MGALAWRNASTGTRGSTRVHQMGGPLRHPVAWNHGLSRAVLRVYTGVWSRCPWRLAGSGLSSSPTEHIELLM